MLPPATLALVKLKQKEVRTEGVGGPHAAGGPGNLIAHTAPATLKTPISQSNFGLHMIALRLPILMPLLRTPSAIVTPLLRSRSWGREGEKEFFNHALDPMSILPGRIY